MEWDKRKVRYTRRELETWSGAPEMAYTWSGIHTELETHGVGHIRGGKHSWSGKYTERDTHKGDADGVGHTE